MSQNNNEFYTSVSQIENAKGCRRRWWFRYVQKFKEPPRKATAYGDIAHAVCDRFLNADDHGLDKKTGQPVDLFPPGWHFPIDRWTGQIIKDAPELTPEEQAQIKFLIHTAIEKGILIREPGREVEKTFKTGIKLASFPDVQIIVKGFKDLVLPDGVMDHKFVKSTKWAKSQAMLREDIQLMFYGLDHSLNHPSLTEIRLGHNQFIKDIDNPKVQQRIIKVTPVQVRDHYEAFVAPILHDMVKYWKSHPKGQEHLYLEVPGPYDDKECNFHYGKQCPYINVCTGSCIPSKYNELLKARLDQNKGEHQMTSLLSTIKQEQTTVGAMPTPPAPVQPAAWAVGGVPVPPTPAPTAPAPEAVIPTQTPPAPLPTIPFGLDPSNPTAPAVNMPAAPAPAAPTQPAEGTPPWFSLTCNVCSAVKHKGFRPDGQPCQICQIQTGVPAQAQTANQDGTVTYDGGFTSTPPAPAQISIKEEVAPVQMPTPPAPTVQPTPVAPIPAPPAPQAPIVQSPATEPPAASLQPAPVGTPQGSRFTLLIGCALVSGQASLDLMSLYNDMVLHIPDGTDHFKALEIVDRYVPEILVPTISEGMIIVTPTATKGSLLHRMIQSLRMYANHVIVGCSE